MTIFSFTPFQEEGGNRARGENATQVESVNKWHYIIAHLLVILTLGVLILDVEQLSKQEHTYRTIEHLSLVGTEGHYNDSDAL